MISYDFSDALQSYEDRPAYVHFHAEENGKILLDFYTNKSLEGQFHFSESENIYKQVAGTCDFSMPKTADAIRAKMRKMIVSPQNH